MYSTEKIDESKYSYIQFLQKVAFNNDIELSTIDKKYDTFLFGLKNTGFFAKAENGEIAAYYGVFPITLQYNGNDILVAQSGDTMTSPNHQKKGLFVKLANETYQYAAQNGVKLVFGFPNENSYPGFKNKLEWVFTGNMFTFSITNLTIPFCELSNKFNLLNIYYQKYVRFVLKKYKINFKEIEFQKFNTLGNIKRDKLFFSYKLRNPYNHIINFNNYQLLIKVHGNLIIGDVSKSDYFDVNHFIISIKKLASILFCRKIILSISHNHWLYPLLQPHIAPKISLPIGFRLFTDAIDIAAIQFIGADYDTF